MHSSDGTQRNSTTVSITRHSLTGAFHCYNIRSRIEDPTDIVIDRFLPQLRPLLGFVNLLGTFLCIFDSIKTNLQTFGVELTHKLVLSIISLLPLGVTKGVTTLVLFLTMLN